MADRWSDLRAWLAELPMSSPDARFQTPTIRALLAERDEAVARAERAEAEVARLSPLLADLDRELLGREVRRVWVEWAQEQANPKPSWLVSWEELDEPNREVDRRIGEALAGPALAEVARLRAVLAEPSEEEADRLARTFHEAYERLAPAYSYETRRASAKPWDEVPANNRGLMRATVRAILAGLRARVEAALREVSGNDARAGGSE